MLALELPPRKLGLMGCSEALDGDDDTRWEKDAVLSELLWWRSNV